MVSKASTVAGIVVGVACILLMSCQSEPSEIDLSGIDVTVVATAAPDGSDGANESSSLDGASGESGDPQSGGTLKLLLGCTDTLDPAVGDCHEIYDELYSRLTAISDAAAEPLQMDLAESYVVGAAGTVYTFTLRRDLKFSDGSPLTAQDVKWSWERALAPGTRSEDALQVLGGIVGAADIVDGVSTELRGVVSADDRTLEVTLTAPRPTFLFDLSDHVAAPLSRANVEVWQADMLRSQGLGAAGLDSLPVGTGPFRVSDASLSSDSAITLEANPHFHGARAHLDFIEYAPLEISGSAAEFDLAGTMLGMFEDGVIDIVPVASKDTTGAGGSTYARPRPATIAFLMFNNAVAPLDDPAFRHSLVAAIDNEALFDESATHSLLGGFPAIEAVSGQLATSDGSSGSQGGTDSGAFVAGTSIYLCHIGSRVGAGEVRIDVQGLIDGWNEQLGVEVIEIGSNDDRCTTQAGIVSVNIALHYPDPHLVFASIPDEFGEPRTGEYERASELVSRSASTVDTVARLASYAEIEAYLETHALVVPLTLDSVSITEVVRDSVRGYAPGRYGGSVYSRVWIQLP